MHILHINSEKDVGKIDKMITQGKHVFILVYMEGCGPCNATRPEWTKMEGALRHQYANNDKLVIVDINKDYISHIKHIGKIDGFPTIKYITNNGNKIELYEDSNIQKKDRSSDSFVNWIETNINHTISTTPTSSAKDVYHRLNTKKRPHKSKSRTVKRNRNRKKLSRGGNISRGGKWSRKYKLSINCNHPKGFSQKQHCKYGRN